MKRAPTTRIQSLPDALVAKLAAGSQPQRTIWSGPDACGQPRGDSDMDPLITKETDERFTDCWVNRGIKISADDMADHYPPLADNSFSREDVRQSLAAIAPMIENLRKALSV